MGGKVNISSPKELLQFTDKKETGGYFMKRSDVEKLDRKWVEFALRATISPITHSLFLRSLNLVL